MVEDKPDAPVEDPEEKPLPRIPPPGRWADVMDEVIEEAMRSGAFDNLPGRGKPLKLNDNPHAPGTDLAYQLLKDNDYTLPWISERKEVIAAIDSLRDDISQVWLRYSAEFRVTPLNDNYNCAPLTIRNAHIGGTVSGAKLTLISLRRADDSNRRTSEDSNERTKERTYPRTSSGQGKSQEPQDGSQV
jgi:hypothetical protein